MEERRQNEQRAMENEDAAIVTASETEEGSETELTEADKEELWRLAEVAVATRKRKESEAEREVAARMGGEEEKKAEEEWQQEWKKTRAW